MFLLTQRGHARTRLTFSQVGVGLEVMWPLDSALVAMVMGLTVEVVVLEAVQVPWCQRHVTLLEQHSVIRKMSL